MAVSRPQRSPAEVTFAVWRALFLREAASRLARERAAWVWLLLEPVAHMAFIMFLYVTIRVRVIGGIDILIWLVAGMLSFFMFRRPAQQSMNAIGPAQPLFAYRQVKPVDPVFVRAALEGFLMVLITMILMGGTALYGTDVLPADPLTVLAAFFGMWLIGLGFGLTASVAIEVVPEAGRFVGMLMQPLYLFSGVILPLNSIPLPYREWLMLNPLAHGVEAARMGFAPYYQAVPELSMFYMYGWALGLVFFGLALQTHFAEQMATR